MDLHTVRLMRHRAVGSAWRTATVRPAHARSALAVGAAVFLVLVSARVVIEGGQAPPVGNVTSGAAAFAKVGCEGCHGAAGRGTSAAPSLAASVLPIKDFIAYVRKPSGMMPPQPPQVVSDASLTDIYAFVHQRGPGQPAAAQASAPAPAGNVEAGAKLFGTVGCYQCHSNEGQGGVQGPRIGPNPVPWARFSTYLRNPTGDMPPYTAAVLTNQDLADIYAFLAARTPPPDVKTIPLLAP
jgi:mono/diheme cytochrome c family protein